MVNFVPAVAYHLCLNLPAGFTQPGAFSLADLCTGLLSSVSTNDLDIFTTTHVEGGGEGGGVSPAALMRLGDGAGGDEAAEALLVRERVPRTDAAPGEINAIMIY